MAMGACAVQFLHFIPLPRNVLHCATVNFSEKRVCAPVAHKKFRKTMDKSKIGAIFEYEFWFWFAKFRSGNFSLENEPRGIPQPKLNNDQAKAKLES